MKAIVLNASPRKNWNTAKLLKSAAKGALSTGAEVRVYRFIRFEFYRM